MGEWVDQGTVWAAIEPVSGSEQVVAGATHNETRHQITMRYVSWLTPGMRMVYKGRIFNILWPANADERNRELQVLVSEGLSNESGAGVGVDAPTPPDTSRNWVYISVAGVWEWAELVEVTGGSIDTGATAVATGAGLTAESGASTATTSSAANAAGAELTAESGTGTESVTAQGATATATGAELSAEAGQVVASSASAAAATGDELTTSAGTATASVSQAGTAGAVGAEVTAETGAADATGSASVSATGVGVTSETGAASASVSQSATATGVGVTSEAGSATASGSAGVAASSAEMTAEAGSATASTSSSASVAATGAEMTGATGQATASTTASAVATGVAVTVETGTATASASAPATLTLNDFESGDHKDGWTLATQTVAGNTPLVEPRYNGEGRYDGDYNIVLKSAGTDDGEGGFYNTAASYMQKTIVPSGSTFSFYSYANPDVPLRLFKNGVEVDIYPQYQTQGYGWFIHHIVVPVTQGVSVTIKIQSPDSCAEAAYVDHVEY